MKKFLIFIWLYSGIISAHEKTCGKMEVWDHSMAMCMPLAMKDMPMKMVMFQANSFFVQSFQEGPKGHDGFAVPNFFMIDAGTSIGDRHYLNVDFMGTFERWTFPRTGYPELLQIGEENQDHEPYLDAQHPHSSPIMGLTLSDTISLGSDISPARFLAAHSDLGQRTWESRDSMAMSPRPPKLICRWASSTPMPLESLNSSLQKFT